MPSHSPRPACPPADFLPITATFDGPDERDADVGKNRWYGGGKRGEEAIELEATCTIVRWSATFDSDDDVYVRYGWEPCIEQRALQGRNDGAPSVTKKSR